MRRWVLLVAMLAGACGQTPRDGTPGNQVAAPPPVYDRLASNPVEHGHRIADVLGCTGCHKADLTGEDWGDPEFGTLWTSNLSRALARYDDAALERAIRGGLRHDGSDLLAMPSFLFTQIGAEDMSALIAFLRSVPPSGVDHPLPALGPAGRQELAEGKLHYAPADVAREGQAWPPDAGASLARGRAIVRATCAECHRMTLAGAPDIDPPRPPLSVVGAYDRAAFHTLMRTGKGMGNRELRLMSDVSRGRYDRFTDPEIDAVFDYLAAIARRAPPG